MSIICINLFWYLVKLAAVNYKYIKRDENLLNIVAWGSSIRTITELKMLVFVIKTYKLSRVMVQRSLIHFFFENKMYEKKHYFYYNMDQEYNHLKNKLRTKQGINISKTDFA